MDFPVLLKYKRSYVYAKKVKEKDIYALVLRKESAFKTYKVLLINENGKEHGRHYDRVVYYDDEIFEKCQCLNPPLKVEEAVNELKQIWM